MGKRVVKENIQINQNTTGVTITAAVAATKSEVVSYTVPSNSELILNPGDFLALYLADAGGVIDDLRPVQWFLQDPQGRRTRAIAEGEYSQFKEFQSSLLKYYMKGRIVIPANFLLKIHVTNDLVTVAATTRFAMSCDNIYETLD